MCVCIVRVANKTVSAGWRSISARLRSWKHQRMGLKPNGLWKKGPIKGKCFEYKREVRHVRAIWCWNGVRAGGGIGLMFLLVRAHILCLFNIRAYMFAMVYKTKCYSSEYLPVWIYLYRYIYIYREEILRIMFSCAIIDELVSASQNLVVYEKRGWKFCALFGFTLLHIYALSFCYIRKSNIIAGKIKCNRLWLV